MSSAQERFFTDELLAMGMPVRSDGRPGQPDIVIDDPTGVPVSEIECKLTTRNSHGGIVLQTDYATLQRKGKLDYLYIVADVEFRNFAVLYFQGLTIENFRVPSIGSRGKAGMLKHTCQDRCTVLYGNYTRLNDRHVERLTGELQAKITPKKRARLEEKLRHWQTAPAQFEIELESL